MKTTTMRKVFSWSEVDYEIEQNYVLDGNYEHLALHHAKMASELLVGIESQKGVFYNTTPFPFIEAGIHAQLSQTYAILARK